MVCRYAPVLDTNTNTVHLHSAQVRLSRLPNIQVDLFALQCGAGGTQIGELVLEQEKGT